MQLFNNKKTLCWIFGFLFFAIFNTQSFSRVILNRLNESFEEPLTSVSTLNTFVSIESLIINGAGYYLSGNSDFLNLLNRVEISIKPTKRDFAEWQKIVSNSLENMTKAQETYSELVSKANVTPYRQSVIESLIDFDYEEFREARHLKGISIDRLENLFRNGDVRETFTALLSDVEKIISMLNEVKAYIDVEKFPPIDKLWRINQQLSETMLFGQYAAEVMNSIND